MEINPKAGDLKKDFEDFLKEKYAGDVEPDSSGYKGGTKGDYRKSFIDFDLKPEELEAYLKKYVEGQEETIEVVATKICTHFNRMKLEMNMSEGEKLVGNIKSNILMIGPTGVGKTYIIKHIANKIGVPFVKGDATKFSETGYVGGDVEDLVRELVREADGNIKLAEYGIIYLDEIDKIATSANWRGVDVSRSGVQRNLLKLMEESEVDLKVPHDLASQMESAMEAQRTGKVSRKKVNTRNILFVVSGAFSGLGDIIRKRLNRSSFGFGADIKSKKEISDSEIFKHTSTEDLLDYGFESEFVGRLPVITVLDELDIQALFNILKSENSNIMLSKKRDFLAYDIKVEFTDEALMMFAERAHKKGTGARGLVNVVENVLIRFEKKLPSSNIKRFTVTRDVVENPVLELKKLVNYASMKEFQEHFLNATGIVIEFSDESISEINSLAEKEKASFSEVCKRLFKDYEYGLKLAGRMNFKVAKDVIRDPKAYLDRMIKDSYSATSPGGAQPESEAGGK